MTEERRRIRPPREYPFGPEWFRLIKLTDDVWGIREPFHVEDVLSYYVKGTKGSVIIDTGMGLADITSLSPTLKEAQILLTHSHWDHVGGAPDFANVSVFNHPFEVGRLKKGWQPNEMVGFTKEYFSLPLPDGFSPEQFAIPGVNRFSTFKNHEVIDLGNITIQVLHTSGHTPGSVCFYIPEKGYLFTGDTLYAGPEYLHLSESDPDEYYRSLEKLYKTIGENLRLIFPGHNNFAAPPALLTQHLLASQGKIKPDSMTEGVDEFGPFIEKKWPNFSFKIPG